MWTGGPWVEALNINIGAYRPHMPTHAPEDANPHG